MTSKENLNENLHKPISGIFAKKFMGPHCNALPSSYTSYSGPTFLRWSLEIKQQTKDFFTKGLKSV
jgi:hypothetical protein